MYAAPEVTGPLTKAEKDYLRTLEETIRPRLAAALEVGAALCKIHDGRLYREFGTWEEYLQQRLGISRSRGCRLMQAARLVEALPVGNLITNERQARELSGLTPETQQLALQRAMLHSKNGGLTADDIREAVKQVVLQYREELPAKDVAIIVNRQEEHQEEEEQKTRAAETRADTIARLQRLLGKAVKAARKLEEPHLEEELVDLAERAKGLK